MARILIIESDPDIRTILITALKRYSHTVRGAPDCAYGLEVDACFHPELVVIDLELPTVNGWATLRQIRARHTDANIPAIAITTHLHPTYQLRALLAGFDDVLIKPFDLDDFIASITANLPAAQPVVVNREVGAPPF